ncbi:acyltransferase family protein [Pseudomonas citronellolis]|uniref:acyltransferase family protein n=1 Tax=Pseudomonas citronellolis TaxID=53408 RepID=UPI0009E83C34|nr:acyltransferase [Pseudomonas citronellolis]
MQTRIHGPDILRGFAALGVVLFHVHYLSGINPSPIAGALFGRFDFLVRLFFSISAFSIFYAYFKRLETQGELRKFYKNRFFRIAPLFYVVLFTTIAINYIHNSTLPDLYEFILSITFLFPFVPGKHGSIVGGGWSLGVEWVFYIFLPLLLCLIRTWRSAIVVWTLTCTVSAFRYSYFNVDNMPSQLREYGILFFLSHLPFFIVGIACFWAIQEKQSNEKDTPITKTLRGCIIVSCFLFLIIYFRNQWSNYIAEEFVISAASYVLLRVSTFTLPIWIDNKLSRYLGSISYSVYLTQFPVISLLYINGVYSKIQENFPNTTTAYATASSITLILVLLISSLSYKYIERPMINFGKANPRQLPSTNPLN